MSRPATEPIARAAPAQLVVRAVPGWDTDAQMFKRSRPTGVSMDVPSPEVMAIEEVRKVAIVGAGTMGQQIGFQCAGHGYEVVLYDDDPAAVEAAGARIDTYAEMLQTGGVISPEVRTSARARITVTADLPTAAQDADLLSEAVPEDPELKGRVLAEFNAVCPPRTIFMTNTSTLLPSQFARASGRADRLLALHFHLPVWINNLADVMPHPGTGPQVTRLVVAFADRIGQVPIELRREHHGYVFNSMYSALNREAITLAQQGVASIEDVDRAWMHVTKAPVGPLGALDAIGLDTVWTITDYWARQLNDDQLHANARFLREYVDRGDVGVKSGRGFYTYPDPAYAQPGFIRTPATSSQRRA
jgi:3-hydroxybutyryl-CoA dehydrogenase